MHTFSPELCNEARLALTANIQADLTHLSLIKISGSDAQKFLQGQFTCDIREITETQSLLGAHCNAKGRIVSFFRIFLFKDSYYLLLPNSILETALANIKKYAVFSKVSVTEASTEFKIWGISGQENNKLLTDTALIKAALIIIPIPGIFPRSLIIAENTDIKNALPLSSDSFKAVSSSAWQLLDIMAGIPAIYPQTIELFTPHQLNLQELNAVSFTKGCYTGQEIIARMQYLGKLKQRMYRASIALNQLPKPGAKLYYNREQNLELAGEIVDAQVGVEKAELLVTLQDSALNLQVFLQEYPDSPLKIV